MPEYQAARTISVYLSMPGGEISTSEIVRNALDEGKKVFIPLHVHFGRAQTRPTKIHHGHGRATVDERLRVTGI